MEFEAVETLFALHNDVVTQLPEDACDRDYLHLNDITAYGSDLVGDADSVFYAGANRAYDIFRSAGSLPEYEHDASASGEFHLTERMLRHGQQQAGGPPIIPTGEIENACYEVELRFVGSLQRHETNQPPSPTHRAAAVLYDTAAEPFAYQKSSGFPLAWAWRDAEFATDEGSVYVPKGAIITPVYDKEKRILSTGPHFDNPGQELLGISKASEVDFLRYSTESLPPDVRSAFLFGGVYQQRNFPEYAEYFLEAVQLTSDQLGERMGDVLKRRGEIPMI